MDTSKEYILCAAIWFRIDKVCDHQPMNIKKGLVVCGRRHHNCFGISSQIPETKERSVNDFQPVQGFLTSCDRFVDRKEAGELAFLAGQIEKDLRGSILVSEDLY